jgi:hypothetical protein
MNEGIFTQPGPDGIFGRGGDPQDATAPSIDSDGQNLRETLVAVFPAPGHMRVARATKNIKTGRTEMHEQYRVPTQKEVDLLAQQGVTPQALGPASVGGMGEAAPAAPGILGTIVSQPWLKLAGAAVVGAVGFWVVNKYGIPGVSKDEDADDGDDGDDEGGDE